MAQQKRRPNTMVYGNLAYDLDTLASQRQLEEAARPERQSQPQQAPRHRTAARPRQRVSPLALCAVGALAAMAVVLVMGYIQLTAVTGSISDLQEQVSQLEDQRVSLVMDYERTFDMAKIKEAAEAAGMKKSTAGQVEYVELGGGSKAEVYQAESDSLLSRLTHSVKNGVGALVEYFRLATPYSGPYARSKKVTSCSLPDITAAQTAGSGAWQKTEGKVKTSGEPTGSSRPVPLC